MWRRILVMALTLLTGSALAADPALLNLLPPEAKVIAGFDFVGSRTTPFGRYVLDGIASRASQLDKLRAETGFDPRVDLSELVVGGTGTSRESAWVAVVRGIFDREMIIAHARDTGARISEYSGVTFIEANHEGFTSLALAADDLVILGPPAQVRAALDRRSGGQLAPATAATVAALSAGRHGWFLMIGSPAELAGRIPDATVSGAMQGDLIKAIQRMSGAVTFGARVETAGEAVTDTAENAEALANVVRFFIGFVRLQGSPAVAATLDEVVRNMRLAATGNTLSLSLDLPEAQFEDLVKLLERVAGPYRAPDARRAAGGDRNRPGRSGRTGRAR